MAIEIVYRVKDRNGKVVGEYMDSKLANIIDKRTDVMYEMADKLIATGLSEEQADNAAEMILNSRHDFVELLKSVKDIPTPKVIEGKGGKAVENNQVVAAEA
ncbi:YebG family protein [Pontibacterium granulatum]|uniref:YebG family protein n=1 Tax=Pontibacterium granulatum TaxID=2036029 RepID=UPI00249C307E|nr:YebG family protein [Pontibacterium granulatum]MDI3324133.1 YebG family protein [Pontibacterium granulatum]